MKKSRSFAMVPAFPSSHGSTLRRYLSCQQLLSMVEAKFIFIYLLNIFVHLFILNFFQNYYYYCYSCAFVLFKTLLGFNLNAFYLIDAKNVLFLLLLSFCNRSSKHADNHSNFFLLHRVINSYSISIVVENEIIS